MKLYIHPASQHVRRVLVTCRELGMDPETVPVALEKGEHKSSEFLSMNPAGQVPVLVDGEVQISESHAIMKYLVGKAGGSALYPDDVLKRRHIDQWLDWTHATLNPPVQANVIHGFMMGDKVDPDFIAGNQEKVTAALGSLNGAFESGKTIDAADYTLAHIAIGTTLSLHVRTGGKVEDCPRVIEWLESIKTREAFKQTLPVAA